MALSDNFVFIGKIVKCIGIKGELKIHLLTDYPERFEKLNLVRLYNDFTKSLVINKKTGDYNFYIKKSGFIKDYIKILFDGYNDINTSEKLKGLYLIINDNEKVKLSNDKFFYFELINFDVIADNSKIGIVKSIENYGGGDLLNISLDKTKKDVLIPLVKSFIKNIDKINKVVEVELLDGIID